MVEQEKKWWVKQEILSNARYAQVDVLQLWAVFLPKCSGEAFYNTEDIKHWKPRGILKKKRADFSPIDLLHSKTPLLKTQP